MLMPTLSLLQPWAWIVVHWPGSPHIPPKRIENRKTLRHIRGAHLIHAGKVFDGEGFDWIFQMITFCDAPEDEKRMFLEAFAAAKMLSGGIIGHVDIVGIGDPDDFWSVPGQNHLKLENVRPLPFHACPGKLSVFEVDYPEILFDVKVA